MNHYHKLAGRPMRIFVCSPLRASDTFTYEDNVAYARDLCRAVVRGGDAPFAPHLLYPQFLADVNEVERAAGIGAGLEYLRICDAMWVAAERYEDCSAGMKYEIDFAKQQSRGEPSWPLFWTEEIPVVYMPEPFKTVSRIKGGG